MPGWFPLQDIIRALLRALFRQVDRDTDDPIMRRRVNKGSDRFFAEQADRDRKDPALDDHGPPGPVRWPRRPR